MLTPKGGRINPDVLSNISDIDSRFRYDDSHIVFKIMEG